MSGSQLDAVPVRERPRPPILADGEHRPLNDYAPRTVEEAFEEGGSFTFRVENIFFNADVDEPFPNAPPFQPGLSIEFFMAPQGTSVRGADSPFLIHSVPLPPSGTVEVELPAGVPLFEVIRTPIGGIARGRDDQIFHVGGMNFARQGEQGRCVGCHAGHSMMEVPEDATWTNLAGSASLLTNSHSSLQGTFGIDGRSLTRLRDMGHRGDEIGPVQNLVDRRTDGISFWLGSPDVDEHRIILNWPAPIVAREMTIYGVRSEGLSGQRTTSVSNVSVSTGFRSRVQMAPTVVDGVLPSDGSVTLELDPTQPFDNMQIRIPRVGVSGNFETFTDAAALAEISVLARQAAGTEAARAIRGDADCNREVNLSDAVGTLRYLFRGGGELCCEVAADANDDDTVDIADAMATLNWLFLGSVELPSPARRCGWIQTTELSCAQQICP